MSAPLSADEQAFWDAAALAALGPVLGAETSGSFAADVAASAADALLEERRKRAPSAPSADVVRCEFCKRTERRCEFCKRTERRCDTSAWSTPPAGVEGLVCPACTAAGRR